MLTLLTQPDKHGDKVEEAEETAGELVIATEDPTIVFDAVDEALNQVPVFVEMEVNRFFDTHIGAKWNDRLCLGSANCGTEGG